MPVNENRLREIVLAEIDAELDSHPYAPEDEYDLVDDFKTDLEKGKDRGKIYAQVREAAAQLARLMMGIARG